MRWLPLTESSTGTVVWLGAATLAGGAWLAFRRDLRRGRPFSSDKRRGAVQLGIALVLKLEAVQTRIDAVTRLPSLGILVGEAGLPVAVGNYLQIYDDLTDASPRRRHWHRAYPLAVGVVLLLCWQKGFPHDQRPRRLFNAITLEEGNQWRDAFALVSTAAVGAQCIEGVLAAQSIVLHLYATGSDRALCLRSLLFGLGWGAGGLLSIGNAIPAAVHLIDRKADFHMPVALQQGLALAALAAQTMGALAARWSLGSAGGPAHNKSERGIERLLRALLVVSCYEDVRQLAGILQDVVPGRPARVCYEETRLGRVYRLAEIETLLQLFKGTINDARLALVGYVDMERAGCADGTAPERAAQAFADALGNFQQDRVPDTPKRAGAPINPLSEGESFNDDRFLAAVACAYRSGVGADLAPGARLYSPPILAVYDLGVLGFSNSVVWRCPTRLILDHYNAHVSDRHLDVGVGTGYFLDHCIFPARDPALTLMDLNPHSLTMATRRVRRYHPTSLLADVTILARPRTASFDSIGINYLLHCLPGPMSDKGAAIGHLATLLKPGGVLFGTTILGQGAQHGRLARAFLRIYNQRGVFGNTDDSVQGLTDALAPHFSMVSVYVVGSVAFFAARL